VRICEINDIASVATELSDGLRARGHDVTVIRPRLVGGSLPWMVKPVVGPIRAMEWAQIIQQVRAGQFDMVHIHYAYLGMLGVVGKFPYLLHCHGSDIREMTPFTKPLVEGALSHAERVFYATPDLATDVLARRPDAMFLPNPVDVRTFAPAIPSSAARGVYICCGLSEIKGVRRLYRAAEILARERPDVTITAWSQPGTWRDRFAALPNMALIPHQPRSALPAIINRHEVVIGQVLLGSIGMAELESMACARPVVAWFRYNSAYREGPPLVRAVDGWDIAHAVMRLLDDPSRRDELGARARAWVAQYHSLDGAAAEVEAAAGAVIRTARKSA
jgi:glycosyltransferase involved in cell wall biosynthesis